MIPYQIYAYNTLLQPYHKGCSPEIVIDQLMPVSEMGKMFAAVKNDNSDYGIIA